MTGDPVSTKVFISYSSRDRQSAFALRTLLEARGCEVWLDYFDIKPAEQLDAELSAHVQRADVVCLLLSPTAVASKWVNIEIEHARTQQERGLRILPIILRPCKIPELLGNTVGIDATDGLDNEAVQLRVARAVLGEAAADDTILLDAARREWFERREWQLDADRALPAVAAELARVRNEPIRRLELTVDHTALPIAPRLILELRLTLDPLWTQPMSFYIAVYREGDTWPEEFGFDEPPYTHYFGKNRPRIDAKFKWFDRIEPLDQTIDGTDLHDLPATFSLEFDGKEFQPGGPGIHLRQTFEVPSLQRLVDQQSGFTLIAHNPAARTAELIDLTQTDLDVRLVARFPESEPSQITLFRSTHDRFERAVLAGDYLSGVDSAIEREALLNLYPPVLERRVRTRDDARRRIAELAETGAEPPTDDDRRLVARLLYGRALLAAHRAQHLDALTGFQRVATLLEPLVLGGHPTYDDGVLMYQACAQLVGYFLERREYRRAADFVNSVGLVAQRLVEVHPNEPNYQRLWADALLKNAIVHAENGERDLAARELRESVDTWRRLFAQRASPERLRDARQALASGLDFAARWGIESAVPTAEWEAEVGGDPAKATADESRDTDLPAWLRPVELEQWPTEPIERPLLRYAVRVRRGWSTTPHPNTTPMEVEHVYRGPGPADWLIVAAMDRADPAADMKDWVDAVFATIGFPVLAMRTALDPPPELLEWSYRGSPQAVAEALSVDEVHLYTGLAQIPGQYVTLARIYILMARRGALAWKVTLSFESAVLPGMPESMIAANDHVRAGASLGHLRLL